MACGFWLNFVLFCYLVSLKNIWDLSFVLTAWNIPLLCFSLLAQNRNTHCNSREHEKSQEGLGIFFQVYFSHEGSKMARRTRDLSNLTLRILKYHVRMKICMNSHIFKGQQHRSQIAVRLAAGIFCFSPHLGEISWFLKMVSHTDSHSPFLVAILSRLSKSQQAKVLILTISVFTPHPQHVLILGSESLQIYNTCPITEWLSLFVPKNLMTCRRLNPLHNYFYILSPKWPSQRCAYCV